MPTFTIIIPSIRSTTVSATINSIKQQNNRDWEMLVVGQGDSDDVKHAVAMLSESDPRIRYIHIMSFGVSRARNAGVLYSSGKAVCQELCKKAGAASKAGTVILRSFRPRMTA